MVFNEVMCNEITAQHSILSIYQRNQTYLLYLITPIKLANITVLGCGMLITDRT